MKICPNCKKQYKIEKCFQKHLLLCNISKENLDKCISLPTKKEMWVIIQQQNKYIQDLKKRVDLLEKNTNKDIKKINIIQWLNKNIEPNVDINIWIKNRSIHTENMYLIWRTDFDNGLNIILENNIISEEVLPFKAFNHKNKELYIYNKKNWDKEFSTKKKAPDREYLKNYDKMVITETNKKQVCYKKIEGILINNFKVSMNQLIQFQFNI